MDFSILWNEFLTYIQLEDFKEGLFVEVSGIAIEIVLILILVPLTMWLINFKKNQQAKQMAAFYTLQFHRDTIDILLKLGGVTDSSKELNKLLHNGQIKSISNHRLYGNTENLLQLLKIRLRNYNHIKGHHTLSRMKAKALGQSVEKLLEDIDRYIFLFNSIGLQKYSKKFFEARILIYPLRDYILSFPYENKNLLDVKNEFYYLTSACVYFFDKWFKEEKKLLDTKHTFKYIFQMCKLIISLPYILIRRMIMPTICRLRKKPYIDKSGSNFFTLISSSLQLDPSYNIDDVEKNTRINKKLLNKYFNGYKHPSEKTEKKILTYFMQYIEPKRWNELVITTLMEDVDNQNPNLVTIEAVKAKALHIFLTFIVKENGDEEKYQKNFFKLFFLYPSN